MNASILCGLYNFAFWNRAVKQGNIFLHGSCQQKNILVDGRQRIYDDMAREVATLYFVKDNFAGPFLIKPRNDFGERRFAATRRPDYCRPMSRLNMQIKIFQKRWLKRTVAKRNIFQFQFARKSFSRRIFSLILFGIILEIWQANFEKPCICRQS